MNTEKIGFIGLGIMGKPMALNLLRAGYPIAVFKGNKAATELAQNGASLHETYKSLAEHCTVVITMLPDSPQVEEVVYGKNGVLEGIQQNALFMDMSTIASTTSKAIYDAFKGKGVEALDAPVSGGQVGAENASLSIMAGGAHTAFIRALSLFETMGKNIVYMGEAGAGQLTKACNQLLVGMTIQAVSEAFALAKKGGIDLEKLREVLLGGFAQSRILDLHGKRIIDQQFEPGFKIRLHRKDMELVLQTGKELGVPLYGAAQVASTMDAALSHHLGEADHSALAKVIAKFANIVD